MPFIAACLLGCQMGCFVAPISVEPAVPARREALPGASRVALRVQGFDRRPGFASPPLDRLRVGQDRNGLGEQTYPDYCLKEPLGALFSPDDLSGAPTFWFMDPGPRHALIRTGSIAAGKSW
jgi:hypothetical protein